MQELVIKTVLFVMSLLPDVCQSFLVITTSSLAFWEAEFKRLAPFINVAVYDGDSDVRKSIQDLKFDTNGSSVMSHVFLAHLDAILEVIDNDIQHVSKFLNLM
jgi:SNF2 family DNA or RNA helicase